MKRAVLAMAFTLAACGPVATTVTSTPPMEMSCAAFANATAESLTQRFGAANIADQTLDGPEGMKYQATVIFPNDPSRRIEVQWADLEHRTTPTFVSVNGEHSQWIGPHGLALGQTLAEVEQRNGKPFAVYGFDWDYGGTVSNWKGGAFAPDNGCLTQAAFRATASNYDSAIGDQEFQSDGAAIRSAAPRLAQMSVSFANARAP